VLALAKRMLRRKDKDSIVEAAYNRCDALNLDVLVVVITGE
jgi:hypothetical protein